ncbi:MAG TPA: SgcJ/EcaC family oxidoreductase [Acetobacteraceae bacterium]|nr:SgcJ/EcaC family oxidoreductase [Acetobacteraceae bacterium]
MLARLTVRCIILAIYAVVGIGGGGSTALARTVTCSPITPKQVAALFDRWNASLAKSPDVVVANYAADAVLLPTKENGPLIGRAAIRGYFVHFLELHPSGAIVTRTIMIGCNMAFDAGLYDFTVDGAQPGSRSQIKARYTFIYEPRGGRWLIVHHHSSALPVPGP